MERLTTGLDDGTTAKLRALSGGERRVGRFLSIVTQWLWTHKEQLEALPLADYTLMRRTDAPLSTQVATYLGAVGDYHSRLSKLEDSFRGLEEIFRQMTEQELDELNARARQANIRDLGYLFSRLSDEELDNFIATMPHGEWIAKLLSELTPEEIAELKTKSRQAQQNKTTGNHESYDESYAYANPQVSA